MNIKTIIIGLTISILSVALAMGISYIVTRTGEVEITVGTPVTNLQGTPQVAPTSQVRLADSNTTAEPTSSFNCTFPINIWIQHPSAWRISSYRISDRLYTKSDIHSILVKTPEDARARLLVQIFVTVLNQQNGADATSIRVPYNEALTWLRNFIPGTTPSDGDLQKASEIAKTLEQFNNGQLSSPPCTYDLAVETPDFSTVTLEPSLTATFYRSIITRIPPTRTPEPPDPKNTRVPTRVPPTPMPVITDTQEPGPTEVPTWPPAPTSTPDVPPLPTDLPPATDTPTP